jgi:hypothetical protein
MRELDDQLKTLKKFSPDGAFEGNWYVPYMPSSGSSVAKKAFKELLQRQSSWGLTPEELGIVSANSDSETFSIYGDDKGDKDKKSSLQQFYDALNNRALDRKKQDGTTDLNLLGQNKRLDTRREFDSEDESSLPAGIRDKAQKLKDMVNEDTSSIFNPTRAHSSFDNFFGLVDGTPAPNQGEPVKPGSASFIDQFKKTLDRQSAASSLVSGVNALVPNADPAARAMVPGLEPFVASTHHALTENTFGNSTTLEDPTVLRDLNSTVLNQWNPLYQPPKLELPKPAPSHPSSATIIQVPRRQF